MDPRKARTTEAILSAAESLIGQHGVNGVTFKQIGERIGSANRNVVQYHMGDMDQMVKHIFAWRLPALEARRAALLSIAEAEVDAPSVRALLDILFRPIFETVDDEGVRVFARFLCGVYFSDRMDLRAEFAKTAPVSDRIIKMLGRYFDSKSRQLFPIRLLAVSQMIVSFLARLDSHSTPPRDEQIFQDLLSISAAALLTPTTNPSS
ncbi:MAG: TetR family transcriptional regulator [Hyphomonadaceae bacterium]|nr:TetR family transcriptional regulator [Hyphomonadaceae bacterium]